MVQPDVAAGDVKVVVDDVHRGGFVNVAQDNTDVFGVSDQRQGVIGILPLPHFHGLVGDGMPKRVQRFALVVDKSGAVVQTGMVEGYLQVFHAAALVHFRTLEAAPQLVVAFTLMCQCHEAVFSVGKVQIHVVAILP